MPDFHAFLTQKYPLYSNKDIKVNLTVKQLLELVEEYISETSPVFEVKVVDKVCFKCGNPTNKDKCRINGKKYCSNCVKQ